ncbi:unnamed protein product [Colias eurytheme]|nr:unnamed protein product [Colias eurytheme]
MLPTQVRCIVCHLVFCCSECRRKHEQNTHSLTYECPICRGSSYLCEPKYLNQDFIDHLTTEHLPLRCKKCNKIFAKMEDLVDIEKCTSISELIETEVKKEVNVEERFDSIYEKIYNEGDNFEAILSVNKSSKTAIITPIIRKKYLVDYESSDDADSDESPKVNVVTPHPKMYPKTPRHKRQRAATPHAKKLMGLIRQNGIEEYEETMEDIIYDQSLNPKTPTPSRNDNHEHVEQDMTTPTSHLPHVLKVPQIVSTSTPTNPTNGGWTIFPNPGNDSPLSEIEIGESPAQSTNNEPSKSEQIPKLKGIITGSRLKLGSQDSSEKQVTFQDSEPSVKSKRVKFANDTIFSRENQIQRVYRKPKRMLTPGPQRPKYTSNPRFQALINRFENRVATVPQTPVNIPDKGLATPSVEHNVLARAISFKESPGLESTRDTNELFSTCVDTNEPVNNAITTLTTNIVGSLQTCLTSLLKTNDEETEIQFKFVITKKKVSVKRMADNGDEDLSEIDRDETSEKENIWSTVTKAVKKVFWGEKESPYRPHSNDSTSSSASKRKYDDLSDAESPLNHKRHRYEGRIRGRPPLQRTKKWGVTGLKTAHSAENQSLVKQLEDVNQSF